MTSLLTQKTVAMIFLPHAVALRSSAVQDDGYVYVKNAFLFSGVA
jgi:hypothetical protein